MKLKILSWNIWNEGRFDLVKEFLKNQDADIIGLQEVLFDDPTRDVVGFLKGLGYEFISSPGASWLEDGKRITINNAVFSRHKIVGQQVHELTQENQRTAIEAVIELPGGREVHVFSVHLLHTHQKPNKVQETQADKLISVLPEKRAILMGDFNSTPESYAVRKISEKLINSDPSNQPTWSVYPEGCHVCKPDKIDIRLDYIFASQDIKIFSPKVESSKASDHLPISAIAEV